MPAAEFKKGGPGGRGRVRDGGESRCLRFYYRGVAGCGGAVAKPEALSRGLGSSGHRAARLNGAALAACGGGERCAVLRGFQRNVFRLVALGRAGTACRRKRVFYMRAFFRPPACRNRCTVVSHSPPLGALSTAAFAERGSAQRPLPPL